MPFIAHVNEGEQEEYGEGKLVSQGDPVADETVVRFEPADQNENECSSDETKTEWECRLPRENS